MPTIKIDLPGGASRWISWEKDFSPDTYIGFIQNLWKTIYLNDTDALARLVVYWFTRDKVFLKEKGKLKKLWNDVHEQMNIQDKSASQVWTDHLEENLYMALHAMGVEGLAKIQGTDLYNVLLKEVRRGVELGFGAPLRSKEYKNISTNDLDKPRAHNGRIGEHGDQRDTFKYSAGELEKLQELRAREYALVMHEEIAELEMRQDIMDAILDELPLTPAQRQAKSRALMKKKLSNL